MQKARVIQVPANNQPPIVVRCTLVTRRMQFQEDASVNNGAEQGLVYALLTSDSSSLGGYTAGPDVSIPPDLELEPVVIEAHPNDHSPDAEPIGNGGSFPYPVAPGGPITTGTVIFRVRSLTNTPTAINVTEWN
jgi:hypothetical protein